MPVTTQKYRLKAFNNYDVYSAAVDQERFVILDNELAFLSDIITDGRISGWEITAEGLTAGGTGVLPGTSSIPSSLSVSEGMGIINRFVLGHLVLSRLRLKPILLLMFL